MSKEDGLLSTEQVFSCRGCGIGTRNACFAIARAPEGFVCLMINNPDLASQVGIALGWRVNVDETDNKAWCPLGVLKNSKNE